MAARSEIRLCSSLTANPGSDRLFARVVVRMPRTTETLSRTMATTPVARVVYQTRGLVVAITADRPSARPTGDGNDLSARRLQAGSREPELGRVETVLRHPRRSRRWRP